MRRGILLLAVAGAAALVPLFRGGGSSSLARQEEAPPPRLANAPALAYQGVASCTSAACHHGNGPPGTPLSEYTTWIAGDPHARAYIVLFDPRSLRIGENYRGPKGPKPHEDGLCLSCHVHPDFEKSHRSERYSAADGVGCESCHGPAEKWLSVHYSIPKADRRALPGMWDTRDVRKRAEVCVRCHVGSGEADVNHDLIAAGHPRLRFEYGAYLANYPARHWRLADDHARHADFEARAWLLGQVVSAKAALDLLQYRAGTDNDRPWPEFAEYGCFACHHDLSDQAWRRRPGVGALPWGTWYFSQLPTVAGELRGDHPADRGPFDALAKTMARTVPDRRRTIAEAAQAAGVLGRWAHQLQDESWDEKALAALLADLVRGDEPAGWDGAAQRYLGIAAVYNALGHANGRYRADAELKAAVRRVADALAGPFRSRGEKYDSPRGFEPDLLRKDLQQLREELRRRGVR